MSTSIVSRRGNGFRAGVAGLAAFDFGFCTGVPTALTAGFAATGGGAFFAGAGLEGALGAFARGVAGDGAGALAAVGGFEGALAVVGGLGAADGRRPNAEPFLATGGFAGGSDFFGVMASLHPERSDQQIRESAR